MSHTFPFILAAAASGNSLATTIRNWIGPLFLLAIGIAAFGFLFQKQFMKLIEFVALAVVVAVLFYDPGVIQAIGQALSQAFG